MGIEEDTPLSLDEILKTACPEEKEFQLIKEGSRKRYLTRYKKKYIELSRKKGYPYNQIGKNINISAAAARKIFTKTQ